LYPIVIHPAHPPPPPTVPLVVELAQPPPHCPPDPSLPTPQVLPKSVADPVTSSAPPKAPFPLKLNVQFVKSADQLIFMSRIHPVGVTVKDLATDPAVQLE